MKIVYELEPADLKAAISAWMLSKGLPVRPTDDFAITAAGEVTITTTNAPESNAGPVLAPITPVVQAPVVQVVSTGVPTLPSVSSMNVVGGPVPTIVPPIVPIPGHFVQVDPPLSITGQATEFGYKDSADNGLGFFYDPATNKPYLTNNDVLRGVSLPREVMLSTFLKIDSWKTEGIDEVWSRNGSTLRQWVDGNRPRITIDSGGKSASDLPIVDAGPSANTGNCIDLTGKITAELGTGGKALATFMILVAGAPIPIRGWSWETGKVG